MVQVIQGQSLAPGYAVGMGMQPTARYQTTPSFVNYGGVEQPITRTATGYSPGGTMGGFGVPGQKPMPPAMMPTSQVPAMSGALSGANGLAGAPGGYSAMPGGFSGTAPGLAPAAGGLLGAAPDRAKLDAYREYDPLNLGTVGGLLASAAGALSPIAGVANLGRHVYNTAETNAYASKFGQPLSFGQWLGGILGLNQYGAGNISADGKTYAMGSPNPGNPKGSDRGVHGGVTAQARGPAPAGSTSMRDAAATSITR